MNTELLELRQMLWKLFKESGLPTTFYAKEMGLTRQNWRQKMLTAKLDAKFYKKVDKIIEKRIKHLERTRKMFNKVSKYEAKISN